MEFYALAEQCSPQLQREVVAAISHTESRFNPFAIGVVGGSVKQPTNYRDAVLTVRQLQKDGRNFSVGITQVNKSNFTRYGLTESNMFDPCSNMKAGASIFKSCLDSATNTFGSKHSYDGKLRLAASCYYSGNFTTGFKQDFKGQPPYVTKFYNNLLAYRGKPATSLPTVSNPPLNLPLAIPAKQPSVAVDSNTEYMTIVNAIKEQNAQLAASNQSIQVIKPMTDTQDIEEGNVSLGEGSKKQTFKGDVFAVPKSDLFSKQTQFNKGA